MVLAYKILIKNLERALLGDIRLDMRIKLK
jgi:hypothetical protein